MNTVILTIDQPRINDALKSDSNNIFADAALSVAESVASPAEAQPAPQNDIFDLELVPLLSRSSESMPDCVFASEPKGMAAEEFRLMQQRLVSLSPKGGSALLTSPGAGDGKSLNTRNLAWALAEAGHSTILLELDLRRPTQARYMRAQLSTTIVEVLSGSVSPASAVRRVGNIPLFYIGLHKPADNPTELIRSAKLTHLLTWARHNFTWVIVDGPPVLAVADVEELLPKVDLVLMIARERSTPRVMLEKAAERLGKRLNFVIFNDVSLGSIYGYGYDRPSHPYLSNNSRPPTGI